MDADPAPTGVEDIGLVARFGGHFADALVLASATFVGWVLGGTTQTSWVLAVLLPAAIIGIWGVWLAPQAPRRLGYVGSWRVKFAVLLAVGALGVTADGMWWFPTLLFIPLGSYAADFSSQRN
ncbi:DUF2568 domain-containing protein [Cellulomonas sp. PhB150]|uniref:DUF2568 domain-containing protein n=1 Tax=Cellulomonas sp. PhB150 TaxID=2485188 RepID=UPI000F465EFD|nr:DUF2568 domain-containing protein [Cellulomonas sp. PhB150]ROS23082.1 uncharacterized protein DUF2568 [Cellulomonas sp. PhB150]